MRANKNLSPREHKTRPGDVAARAKGSPMHLRAELNCPFPGCALAIDHDGDHIPKLRRVQIFRGTIVAGGVHPGYCEIVEGCFDEAVALYATSTGKAFGVCLKHENQILKSGATSLLKGWCA